MSEAVQEIVAMLEQMSEVIRPETHGMMKKPVLGGVFGSSGFLLASMAYTDSGLHSVRYFVFHESGMLLGIAESKEGALRFARKILTGLDKLTVDTLFAKYRAKRFAELAEERRRIQEADEQVAAMRRSARQKVSSIPKRRQRIFDEAGGKCHYCETVLTLDGKWHIEHKHPKALGGDNQPGNLVASCVPCNMKKRDTTDQEFKARLAKEKAA